MGTPTEIVAPVFNVRLRDTAPRQIKFWAELFIAIARFESNWRPHEIFHEPPPLGVDSVGLLQLSYEDEPVYRLEHLDRNVKSLEDPLVNLRCGVKIMRYSGGKG